MHVKQEVKQNRFCRASFLHATDLNIFLCVSKFPKETLPLTEEGELPPAQRPSAEANCVTVIGNDNRTCGESHNLSDEKCFECANIKRRD